MRPEKEHRLQSDYGHFDAAAREYVIRRPDTPAPWVNYLIGEKLTAMVSQAAGGWAFYEEPSEGRLTRYRFNGLPIDSPGFYLYVDDGQEVWSPSFQPVCTALDRFECRHGPGYTRFQSERNGIGADVTYVVPVRDAVLLWPVVLRNLSRRTRRFKLSTYVEFSVPNYLRDTLHFLVGQDQWQAWYDERVNGILIDSFIFETWFQGQCIFASTEPVDAFDVDRDMFIGAGRTEANPIGLEEGPFGSQVAGGGAHACGVLQHQVTLKRGEEKRIVFRLAAAETFAESRKLLRKYRTPESVERAVNGQRRFWEDALSSAQVETPDEAVNEMLNTWLPRNIQLNFRFARSISNRHTGCGSALRYRDSSQDAMPGGQLWPAAARERILAILQTMRRDGSTLYGVNPRSLEPDSDRARSVLRCDAAVWGCFTVYQYLVETGDMDFLDVVVPYYGGGEGTVFDHVYRSLRFLARNTGKDGLPKLFTMDWNDSLHVLTGNQAGCQSVMVAEQFIYAARLLSDICDRIGRTRERGYLTGAIRRFTDVLNGSTCWDGAWFRRVIGDDIVLGSRRCKYGRIFLNTQTWAAIAGTLDPDKVQAAMDSVHELLDTDRGLRLSWPSSQNCRGGDTRDTGRTPGAGENGGIFVHANTWAIMAEAMLGNAERAWKYFSQVLPPNLSRRDPERFAESPYAIVSWLYAPDHPQSGRGQYAWVTGGAAWMYLVGLEYILGIKPTFDGLAIAPCIPADWPGYRVRRRWRNTLYDITVENPDAVTGGGVELTVGGNKVEGNVVPLVNARRVKVKAIIRASGSESCSPHNS